MRVCGCRGGVQGDWSVPARKEDDDWSKENVAATDRPGSVRPMQPQLFRACAGASKKTSVDSRLQRTANKRRDLLIRRGK